MFGKEKSPKIYELTMAGPRYEFNLSHHLKQQSFTGHEGFLTLTSYECFYPQGREMPGREGTSRYKIG